MSDQARTASTSLYSYSLFARLILFSSGLPPYLALFSLINSLCQSSSQRPLLSYLTGHLVSKSCYSAFSSHCLSELSFTHPTTLCFTFFCYYIHTISTNFHYLLHCTSSSFHYSCHPSLSPLLNYALHNGILTVQ